MVGSGQNADQGAGSTHQSDRDHQHPLAAEPVAEGAEEEATERPGQEADRQGREAGDRACGRAERGEEDLAEDQRRGQRVQREVVVLQGAADGCRQGGPLQVACVLGVVVDTRCVRRWGMVVIHVRSPMLIRRRGHSRLSRGGCDLYEGAYPDVMLTIRFY